jgi:oligopeptide transport system ATP-binding protein
MSTPHAVPPLLLDVRDLEVRYAHGAPAARAAPHRPLRAVAGISFQLAQGESLGVVGESGSGKSSLARALLRLIPATGSALFLGQDLLRLQGSALRATRERLQIIFQDPHGALDPHMRVADIVAEPLLEFPATPPDRRREAVARMLARVGLGPELLERYPQQLSGGQAQRVAIARALMLKPRLLICDEPMAALDVSIKAQITNLLREMRDSLGLSLLFIAHDLPAVRYLCERIMVLYQGQIMELAGREALFADARHPYTRALLAATPLPNPARPHVEVLLPEAERGPGTGSGGCPFQPRCPLAIARCAVETPRPRAVGASLVACHRADDPGAGGAPPPSS